MKKLTHNISVHIKMSFAVPCAEFDTIRLFLHSGAEGGAEGGAPLSSS